MRHWKTPFYEKLGVKETHRKGCQNSESKLERKVHQKEKSFGDSESTMATWF